MDSACWNCNGLYLIDDERCPHCCATNPNIDLESAQMEVNDTDRINHDWKFVDASFDHEFGTEQVHYFECEGCGKTRDVVAGDFAECDDATP